jgi:hypothetical protein
VNILFSHENILFSLHLTPVITLVSLGSLNPDLAHNAMVTVKNETLSLSGTFRVVTLFMPLRLFVRGVSALKRRVVFLVFLLLVFLVTLEPLFYNYSSENVIFYYPPVQIPSSIGRRSNKLAYDGDEDTDTDPVVCVAWFAYGKDKFHQQVRESISRFRISQADVGIHTVLMTCDQSTGGGNEATEE